MKKDPFPKIYLYRRIVQAKLFIDDNFSETINLDQISGEAYFSKFHFIRLFKKIYGKTPHQYLIVVRLDKALLLLRSGIPVSDTCYAVGFESLSSFSGLFKKYTGWTPSDYLAIQLKLKEQLKKTPLKFVPNCFAESKGWLQKSNFGETDN